MIEEMNTDFDTEKHIKKQMEGVPGVGSTARNFSLKVALNARATADIKQNYGLDAVVMTRKHLCMEAASVVQKAMVEELSKMEPLAIGVDALIAEAKAGGYLLASVTVATDIMELAGYVSAGNSTDLDINKLIYLVGSVDGVKVYVNTLGPWGERKAFIVMENIVSLSTAAEGRITEGGKDDLLLVEGSYVISPPVDSKHFLVTK